jgi:hypothetical protein
VERIGAIELPEFQATATRFEWALKGVFHWSALRCEGGPARHCRLKIVDVALCTEHDGRNPTMYEQL